MNKLFSKIAALSVGLAMAVGVGIALGSQQGAKEVKVKADATAISADDLASGDYCYIVADGYVLKAGASFAAKGSGARTAAFDATSLGQDEAWLFTYSVDHWTITTEVDEVTYYLYVTNDNNGLVCGTKENAGTKGNWTVAETAAEASTSFLTANDGTQIRYLANYNNSNFRCYKNTSSGTPQIQLYRYSASSKTVSSIAVTTQPTKTVYVEGEQLDLSGLVVTATWSDSSQSDCTASAIFSPADGAVLSPSDSSVTVSYGGKTTSIAITVSEKVFATYDLYLTADVLGLTTSYSNNDVQVLVGGEEFTFGRADVMKGLASQVTKDTIQLKRNSGKLFNKSKFSAPISKVIFMADADNNNAPANWKVYGSATTAGSTATEMTITTVDATNRIYSVDFSSSPYYFFTVSKTGDYATYFDMIVVELVHSDDDVAAVRLAASNMLSVFSSFCSAGKGPSAEQWNSLAGIYSGLTNDQKAIFDACVLNTFACNSADPYGAPVQGTDLQKAVQKIEYCVSAYGVENFTGRDIPSAARFNSFTSSDGNNMMIIIVVISSITVLSLGVLIALKKKKHN